MPKVVTIKDIAREAGVSPSLVSFVFNGKNRVGEQTRQRILEVADRLGYRTGQAARVPWPAARIIGIIVPSLDAAPLQALSDCAYRRGYTVLFASAQNDPVRFCHLVRALAQKGVEGFVASPLPGEEEDCLTALNVTEKPYVPLGENPDQTIIELIEKI
jgi:LacI family transcriptional regulator